MIQDPDILIALIPTSEGWGLLETPGKLQMIAQALGKKVFLLDIGDKFGVWRCRKYIVQKTARKLGLSDSDSLRAIFIDSDVSIGAPGEITEITKITEYIKRADSEGESFVIPIKTKDGTSQLRYRTPNDKLHGHYTMEDIQKNMNDWSPVEAAGLGFYYGDLPVGYSWPVDYEPDDETGEDIAFFLNNKIQPRVAKNVKLYHHVRLFI